MDAECLSSREIRGRLLGGRFGWAVFHGARQRRGGQGSPCVERVARARVQPERHREPLGQVARRVSEFSFRSHGRHYGTGRDPGKRQRAIGATGVQFHKEGSVRVSRFASGNPTIGCRGNRFGNDPEIAGGNHAGSSPADSLAGRRRRGAGSGLVCRQRGLGYAAERGGTGPSGTAWRHDPNLDHRSESGCRIPACYRFRHGWRGRCGDSVDSGGARLRGRVHCSVGYAKCTR